MIDSNDEIQKYIEKKRELQSLLLTFLENSDSDDDFQQLNEFIGTDNYNENQEEFNDLFQLLIKISNNHCRNENFFFKITQILEFHELDIKRSFSNIDLFNIFKSNKPLLRYLFEKNIITLNENICQIGSNDIFFCHFFYPEIKSLIGKENSKYIENDLLSRNLNIFNDFDIQRKEAENDSYICSLIRHDYIDKFVIYVNKTKFPLSSQVNSSIFETNSYLIENNPTLIEYSAFLVQFRYFNI
ncbi:hypothetical protein M9Y10_045577 [Tritrichomonas musculus]|uniref:Uncharacterized protein n=1 Tax=Tritrichomonas musculus TaxID=1915356 RepID=A0ABR2JVZ6_9EUKA